MTSQLPKMRDRQVMQHLKSGEWKPIWQLGVPAGERLLDRMVGFGWIEPREQGWTRSDQDHAAGTRSATGAVARRHVSEAITFRFLSGAPFRAQFQAGSGSAPGRRRA